MDSNLKHKPSFLYVNAIRKALKIVYNVIK